MQLFLDSAKVNEIEHALEFWDIDGITTNPRHVQTAGKPFRKSLEEIAKLVDETDVPVSVEVNPHLTDWETMVDEGLELARISPNFVIKLGASEGAFRALRELSLQGVQTNATLIFSTAQAWHAARCGATYISPFLGWREAHGDDGRTLLMEVATMLENFDYSSQIIAAAIRNARQIADAALAGAHCVTAGFAVYQDSFRNPYTDMGAGIFGAAWDATPKD